LTARERTVQYAAEKLGTITQNQVDDLLREAVGAVSGTDKGYAWSWGSDGIAIELRSELPQVTDPRRRLMLFAAGAVLLNLRILIRGVGVHAAVRLFPDPAQHDLVATVRLEGQRPVTEQDRTLVTILLSGAQPLQSPGTAPAVVISALRRAAKAEYAWLAAQPMSAVPVEAIHAEIPIGGGEPAGTALIIGTVLDGSGAQLQAGQAAQRVAVTAAALGVRASRVRTMLSSDSNRRAVRELLGGGLWPQVLMHTELAPLPSPA
jgi:hypothetical protein